MATDLMNITLTAVTLPDSTRNRKYREFFRSVVVPAAFGQGMNEGVDSAMKAGLMGEMKAWNEENPDQKFALSFPSVKVDGAKEAIEWAFVKVAEIAGAKRGRKPKRGTDTAPQPGETMYDMPAPVVTEA